MIRPPEYSALILVRKYYFGQGQRVSGGVLIREDDDLGDVLGQQRAGIFKRCVAEHEHAQHGHLPFAGGDHADGALGREHGLHADGDGLMGDHIVAAAEHSFAGLNDFLIADVDDFRLHVDVHLFGDALIGVRGRFAPRDEPFVADARPESVNTAELLDLSVDEIEILKRGPDALLFGNVQLGVYLAVEADSCCLRGRSWSSSPDRSPCGKYTGS